ncbi:MAG TPA: alpha/beta hydrolase [Candidatus Sulfotelmatobacter sp.]|nr:alpha/beta hydrolase [Candidatus Sulfotelmatobacter sp.]
MTESIFSGGILPRGGGATIAYERLEGKNPGVVFLHGFRSDMTGGKAQAVRDFCQRRGQAFVRFDAQGHGQSSGRFEDGSIGLWASDAVAVLDVLTKGPQVIVGSSMGGWLMLLAALQRRDRVAGLLGLAAAPDFTEELVYAEMTDAQKREMLSAGQVAISDCEGEPPMPITRHLIEDGRQHLLMNAPITLACPVRLIHGQQDKSVPWETAIRLADHLAGDDVEVTLVKAGGHRLSEPQDIDRLLTVLGKLLDRLEEKPA